MSTEHTRQALVTDLYELNMAASYLRRGMVAPATFSLFVRSLPPQRGFLVAAGLEDCLAYLEALAFTPDDLDWLAQHGFDDRSVDAFSRLRFTGDVAAIEEGRVVLANEPLLEVTAPLPEAQLVETFLLNQVTFQTAVASKAARCGLAAGEIELVDFALRRTHGTEAGRAVARASAIAGFVATSNVDAAQRYGLRAAGTMAHAYIEAFPTERDAFRAFAEDFPGRATFLVDTYDTLGGVAAAIDVIREQGLSGRLAVRLDSGDVGALAHEVRQVLDDADLTHVEIFVSGGLDEHDLERFRAERSPIDGAGIGTLMGVSADVPFLESVYKMVDHDGQPVAKLSAGKATLPGAKQVWRGTSVDADVLTLRGEDGPTGHEPLLRPVMRSGTRVEPPDTVARARDRLAHDLDTLPAEARRITDPVAPQVRVSPALRALAEEVETRLRRQRPDHGPPPAR
jgi:nicotinate phosphoribosyltransferase